MRTVIYVALLLLYVGWWYIKCSEDHDKRKFYATRERLLKIVEEKYIDAGSVVELPAYGSKKIYNAETDKEEFEFIEWANDGRWRRIFITLDGEYVIQFPWKEDRRRNDDE